MKRIRGVHSLALGCAVAIAASHARSETLPFVAEINGVKHEVFVNEDSGRYTISAKDAVRFGARENLTADIELENVSVNIGELILRADLPMSALSKQQVSSHGRDRGELLDQRLGGWLNYTLDARHTRLGTSHSLLTDLNVSLPFGGVLRSLQINGCGNSCSTRLMTNYQLDMPERLLSLSLGDAYSSSYALAGGQKFLGVQLRKNYALNPDYVYWPTLTLSGTARAPSVYEIFENNRRIGGGEVKRGDFEIENYSSFIGESGQVKLVVRDAQGNEQVIVRDLFTAPGSLKEGEISYALDAGVVYKSANSIGDTPYGSGSIRYGFKSFTLEAGADFLGDNQSFLGGIIIPTAYGSFNYRQILGEQEGKDISIGRAGWEKRFDFSQDDGVRLYLSGEHGSRQNLQIGVSYWSNNWSVFGSSIQHEGEGSWLHTAGLSWFLRDISLGASISQSDKTGMVVGLNLSLPIGSSATAHAAFDRDRQGIGAYGASNDWFWSAQVARGEMGWEAVGSLRRDFGPVLGDAYVDHHSGSTAYRGRVLGSIVGTDEGIALARPVTSGVLMVDTGIDAVPVRAGGRTHQANIGSKTVVTNLPSYFPSVVRPDFDLLEGGYTATTDQRIIRIPQGMSEVSFDVRKPGFFVDVQHHGKPVERGVQIQADGEDVIITSSGAYIQPSANKTSVVIKVGDCQVSVPVPDQPLSRIQVEVCHVNE